MKGIMPSIQLNDEKISANYVFNSILFEKPELQKKEYYLLQHFKGWMIETEHLFLIPVKPH